MADNSKRAVRAQFGRQASSYTVSRFHRESPGLAELVRLAAASAGDRVLDIATGTGFTALALAPRCERVIGLDLTFDMVREARGLAAARRVTNVCFCLGDAESIPFGNNTFDIVTCRVAAHHFPDVGGAFSEMARVVKPGGRVVLDDTCAPEAPHLAALMNEWELRRDPSHIANRPPSLLRELMERCGLTVQGATLAHIPQVFSEWTTRAGLPEANATALRAAFAGAPPDAREAFRIEVLGEEIRFAWPELIMLAAKR